MAALFILSSCGDFHYDSEALLYGEIRHEGLIEGTYEAEKDNVIYELIIEGDHTAGAVAVMNVYTKSNIHEETVQIATFEGEYRHVEIFFPEGTYKSRFNSYHADELILQGDNQHGFKASDFNGRYRIEYDRLTASSDGSEYSYSERLSAKPGSPIKLTAINIFNEKECRPELNGLEWYLVK